jgi:AraC-like DNA-binding protein
MLQLSITELLAIIGAAQSLYICVAMLSRPAASSKKSLAILFFGFLFLGFALLALLRSFSSLLFFPFLVDTVWISLPFLCIFLLRDIAGTPVVRSKVFLMVAPFATFFFGWWGGSFQPECGFLKICDTAIRLDAISITAVIAGALGLLSLWAKWSLIVKIHTGDTTGRARYWLILSTIFCVAILLMVFLLDATNLITRQESELLRAILGLTLVYLTTTSLFRIYDEARALRKSSSEEPLPLTDTELAIAKRIENLMNLEKVYQEPDYSRKALARELDLPESAVSRIINVHFQKSVPQLLNELRVGDACRLLRDTKEPISVIAEASGFSSLASFNRVFKDTMGLTPSEFRSDKS